jgi:hypothetical protein
MSKAINREAVSDPDKNPFVEPVALDAVGVQAGTLLLACMIW